MNRRSLVSTTALIAPALALAACAATSTGTTPAVQTVFNAVQFALPLVDMLVTGVSIAFPPTAPVLATVIPYINSAGTVFQTLSTTMTTVQAQPIVQQIEGYVSAVVKAVKSAVSAPNAPPQLAGFAPKVAQAEAALGLLTAFVNGIAAMPTAAMAPLPLLHR